MLNIEYCITVILPAATSYECLVLLKHFLYQGHTHTQRLLKGTILYNHRPTVVVAEKVIFFQQLSTFTRITKTYEVLAFLFLDI